MTAQRIRMGRVGVFVLGGFFLLGIRFAWGDLAPPANASLQPIPASPSTVAPVPAPGEPSPTGALGVHPMDVTAQGQPPTGECTDRGGLLSAICCGPSGRFWFRADYLMWWTSGMKLPPLVTTSPSGTDVSEAGVLGYKNTAILYGDSKVGIDGRSGFRTTLGMWIDNCQNWGVEFDYLSLGQAANGYERESNGSTILARPFYSLYIEPKGTNGQASELVAYPGIVQGSVGVETKDYFQSVGVTMSYNICSCNPCGDSCGEGCGSSCGSGCGGGGELCPDASCAPVAFGCRTDLLMGFRYYNLSDFVGITEDLTVTQTGPTKGTTYLIHDNFEAKNDFYGSELGLRTRIYRCRWSVEILSKIAVGNTHQTVNINGQTIITPSGGTSQTYDVGTFASGTNIGVYQRDVFTVIPQLGVELGYQMTCNWRAFIGYNLLYWGCVGRSGDQIDLNLDPRNFPPATAGGLPYPAYPGKTSCFWAQGVNIGTEFRY
jgi:hypothetical protein